jgi:hypothetical protein
MILLTPLFLVQMGCSSGPSSTDLDAAYSRIQYGLGIAERDTTRNIKDREARGRKILREQEEISFFKNEENMALIQEMRSSAHELTAKKGEGYWMEAIFERSWTQSEKEREEELLARIQAKRQDEVTWSSPDGEIEVSLRSSWGRIADQITTLDGDLLTELTNAWVESKTAWIGEDLASLVRLRNEVARREGFATYWELALAHRGLNPEQVEAFADQLEALVTPLNAQDAADLAALARSNNIPNDWAHQRQISQLGEPLPSGAELDSEYDADMAESRLRESFSDMGLSMEGVQVYPGPTRYTRPGAFSFAIEPPETIAIVISKDRRWSAWHYGALAHEMGLAAWWRSLPESVVESPVLWDPPTAFFEGVGQFFERMATSTAFAQRIDGFSPEIAESLDRLHRKETIDTITHYVACTRTEKMLYERPGDWIAIAKESAALEARLNGRKWETPKNADGMPYVRALQSGLMLHYPAYVQNYLFATATEATLAEAAAKVMGNPVGNAQVGPWLRENLVHPVSLENSFEVQLAILGGDSNPTAALKRYLSSAN